MTTITLHATFLICAATTEVSQVTIRLQHTSLARMGPIYSLESLQISRGERRWNRNVQLQQSLPQGKSGISCCLNAFFSDSMKQIPNKSGWHCALTSSQKTSLQTGERETVFWLAEGGKTGTRRVYFGAASVLNSLAYLWSGSETVARRGKVALAMLMGF